MKKDITTRADIEQLVQTFYANMEEDAVIGYFFKAIAQVDWNKHLPKMYDFWESILFHTASFKGNPIATHQQLHQQSEMKPEHFQHWVCLFKQNVDTQFEGKNAEAIKQKAENIATLMQFKVLSNQPQISIAHP